MEASNFHSCWPPLITNPLLDSQKKKKILIISIEIVNSVILMKDLNQY